MIVSIEGTLEGRGNDWVIVKLGCVSLRVNSPASTLSQLGKPGEAVKLHTHLHLKEDGVALYGFASEEELALFQMLIGVSGIGPRVALAMLSAMNPEQLSLAIASGQTELLTQIPGVGRKMAGRLVLELKEKLERGWVGIPLPEVAEASTEAVAALTALGYSLTEATRAVAALPDSQKLTLEEKVTLALQQLASQALR
jgi:Holliday junction DNA helicase RuvA